MVEIDGEGGVLGETTIPASGPLQTVTVALDFGENWFTGGMLPQIKLTFLTLQPTRLACTE